MGRAARADGPAYASDVVDDHTPFELSLAVGGGPPELRLLVETVDHDSSLAARWQAARALGERLRDRHGADLRRLDAIADLFQPRRDHGVLAMWYAAGFRPGQPPQWKAYVDLRARGNEHARAVLEEALDRLGLAAAYPRLMREAGGRDLLDELVYFSLDLADHDRARVKAYFRHHHATAPGLERALGEAGGGAGGLAPGEIRAFCTAMLGHAGPYRARPVVTCWAFAGSSEPAGTTVYAPIAYYARDDSEARVRVRRWMDRTGIDPAGYERALAAFARRPLEAGVGMHSYVAFKRDRGVPRVTAYLAPEAYQTFPPGSLARREHPAPRRPRSPEQLIRRYEAIERVPDHPLFRRLAREPAAGAPVWTILANNWIAVGDQFPRWLAHLVARVEHDGMRSILARQLNDELGDGDPANAHRVLFQTMLAELAPWAPPGDRDALLGPGRRFAEGLASNYLDRPWLEAVGGTLVAEVYGKQVDQAIGALLRRQRDVDPESLTWLVLHETLEEDHAGEAVELAGMAPTTGDPRAAVCRGAEQLAALGMRYFDELYEVVFR
ncbi:MAG TPA: iron-containing redox enzyme family protein [Kofleriaceae bacterium]|nr:iron-containing redox enzyme family protein [Kofleriaceae bacterium]